MSVLPELMIEPVVRAALAEDLGRAGDITTEATIPDGVRITADFVAREVGVVAGVSCAALAFRLISPTIHVDVIKGDGEPVAPGDLIATVEGDAKAILMVERVALNFMGKLSGIASATARLVAAAKPHKAAITCTRKTTPNLRMLEKAAVRAGGGANHRFGLDDAVLIKDNHIQVVGDVRTAILRAREAVGHLVMIEVEVDTLDQLVEAIPAAPDAVLLDNMSPDMLRRAVEIVDGRCVTEASGGITLESVPAIAATGVDIISAGWLTHSSRSLDIGLDFRAVSK